MLLLTKSAEWSILFGKGVVAVAVILEQLFILYAFLFCGWLFGKKNPNLTGQTGVLSFVMVNLLYPAKVLGAFSKNFTVEYLTNNYTTVLIAVGLLLLLHFVAKLPARFLKRDDFEKQVYEYSITISNYAYMGYALVESVFGTQAMTDLILFCMPFSMYTYSVGYMKLTGKGIQMKRLINPLTCALLLGMAIGLSGLQLPQMVTQFLSVSGACVGPVGMLLTGFTLASFSFRDLLGDIRVYILVALRLIGIPLMVYAIFQLPFLTAALPCAVMMAAMPTGLNTIVFPKSAGKSPALGARMAFISHLASLATLPFWLSLLQ